MPSKAASGPLLDIRRNIALARSFTASMTLSDFKADRRTVYAVIRCLEIISEAVRRLPDDLRARHSDIPWINIASAGNVDRHDYEDVLDEIIWRTVTSSLEPLSHAVERELAAGSSFTGHYQVRVPHP